MKLSEKFLELSAVGSEWILWILINTVSVPLYISRELGVTAVLYVGLWLLAFKGYRDWRRTLVSA